jgi:hypothetical protein
MLLVLQLRGQCITIEDHLLDGLLIDLFRLEQPLGLSSREGFPGLGLCCGGVLSLVSPGQSLMIPSLTLLGAHIGRKVEDNGDIFNLLSLSLRSPPRLEFVKEMILELQLRLLNRLLPLCPALLLVHSHIYNCLTDHRPRLSLTPLPRCSTEG